MTALTDKGVRSRTCRARPRSSYPKKYYSRFNKCFVFCSFGASDSRKSAVAYPELAGVRPTLVKALLLRASFAPQLQRQVAHETKRWGRQARPSRIFETKAPRDGLVGARTYTPILASRERRHKGCTEEGTATMK